MSENPPKKIQEPDELFVTRRELDLMLNALTSRITLLIFGSVALNQFLSTITIPTLVSATAVVGLLGKTLITTIFFR